MKRYVVVLILFVLSLITYIDRVAISSAKEPVARELALSDEAMGAVFGAFALGYALAQIPAGWFADRFGPRLTLALAVSAWSLFTALTGAARSLNFLLVVRFLFGITEAAAFPSSARAFFNWLPVRERGRANGVIFSGSRLGAALAFPVLAWLLGLGSWRTAFAILGVVGLAWVLVWLAWFRDYPPEPPDDGGPVNQASAGGLGFAAVLRSGGMALAMGQYFASNFTFFICLSWMHPYLMRQYELSQSEAAGYAMIPLLAGATAQWTAGFLVDRLYRSPRRSWSRRLPAIGGFALAAAGVFGVTLAQSPAAAVACFTLATFGADVTISPSWAYCMDVGGKNSGAVSGSMNMVGNLGSFVSANAFPYLFSLTGSANAYFRVAAFLNILSIPCWVWMRSPWRDGAARKTEPA
jgi:ACS family glucarate transporter-like MFS transporter